MVSHWSLSDSKSSQVSRTRLRILAVLSNADVWIVSTRPPTSKSSRPFNNPLVTVPNAPITIGTIVTFMFYSFFNSLARSRYLSFFSLSFLFILWSAGTAKSTILQILFSFFFFFFLLIIMRSGLLAGIRWSVCMLKSHRSLCESFSRRGAGLYIYHLFVWSNWNFLHISQWTTLPTQSCLALYSFCANLLHSLIMWLIVLSLSPYSLHWLICSVLSILALIWLVLMALSCAAIRRDSVSLSLQCKLVVFHWSVSECKSSQVFRTLLSILLIINNAVVWMVSTHLPTTKSSSPFSNPLVTVPKAPITIGIIITFMFHTYFNSLVRSRYLSFFSHSFSFILWSAGTAKSTILQILSFFCCCWLLFGLVFWLRFGDLPVCQSPIGVYEYHFLGPKKLLLLLLLFSFEIFHTSICWWLSTGV